MYIANTMTNKKLENFYIDPYYLEGIAEWLKDNEGNKSSFVRQAIDEKLKKDLGRSWRTRINK